MAASCQFPVEFIEHEIAQERRKRTALRGPLVNRINQPVFHHSGLEKGADQLEYPFVGDPFGNASHQSVLVDTVEEFFEVDVNHDTVALSNIRLCLSHRL